MANPNPNQSHALELARANIRHQLQQDPEYQQRAFVKEMLSHEPEPQRNDPDVTQAIRLHSMSLLQDIQRLEEQQRLAPTVNPQLQSNLLQLRLRRDLVYWRAFPINRFPPEILVNIFRYVIWSSDSPGLGIKYRLWLTWVCRRWRSAAIADFTLWNAIWFRDPPPYARSLAWFHRAGTAPLDLRINERDPTWNNVEDQHKFTGEQMGLLLDQLFTKLTTIRTLVIVVDTWPPALVVLDKLRQMGGPGKILNIERFELHRAGTPYVWIGSGYEPHHHRHPITLFGGALAPSLKFLTLNGIHIDWLRSPLTDLTTLDLRRMALEVSPGVVRFREMLKQCPNLHKLSLDGAGPAWVQHEALGLEPVELPSLRILVLGDFSLQFATYVLAQISAPNVRDLTLMNMNGEDYSPFVESLTSKFTEVRLLTLYTFEVNQSPQSRQTMVKFLESLPLLSYLRIAQIQGHLLDAFLERRDDPIPATPRPAGHPTRRALCTNLDVLEFQTVEAEAILAFGRGRKALDCPLRKIYVNGPWVPSIGREQQEELRSICETLCIMPLGAITPEEKAIISSASTST